MTLKTLEGTINERKLLNRLFQVKPIYLTMIETFRICADFKEKLKS